MLGWKNNAFCFIKQLNALLCLYSLLCLTIKIEQIKYFLRFYKTAAFVLLTQKVLFLVENSSTYDITIL